MEILVNTQPSQSSLKDPGEFCLVLGLGDGALARLLCEHACVQEVFLFEPDASKFVSSGLHHPKLRALSGGDPKAWNHQIQLYFIENLRRLALAMACKVYVSPGADTNPLLKNFEATFAAQVKFLSKDHNEGGEEDRYRGLLNTLRNFPEVYAYPDFDSLRDVFKGKPGAVVSTGPSLKHSLPLLKRCREQVVLIACDSALMILLQNGIKPDFVVTLERGGENSYLFREMPRLADVFLVGPGVVNPLTWQEYRGPKLRIHREVDFDFWVSDPPARHDLGNCVSHLAYVCLRLLGCESIFLLGQDLAFDPHTVKSHHEGIQSWVAQDQYEKIPVAGFDGHQQITAPHWQLFNYRFETLITRYGGTVTNVIPADHGVPIPLTQRQDPSAWANEMATRPPLDRGVISRSVPSTLPRDSVERVGAAKLKHIRDSLELIALTSLEIQRALSEFWLDVDVTLPGMAPKYDFFFQKMQTCQEQILAQGQGFFENYFLALIGPSHASLGIQLAALNHQELSLKAKSDRKMQLLNKWFTLLHTWSARALTLLDAVNRERFRYW